MGSGSSGSVVAGRLAEAGKKILLIEAGGPSHFLQVNLKEQLISFGHFKDLYRMTHQIVPNPNLLLTSKRMLRFST